MKKNLVRTIILLSIPSLVFSMKEERKLSYFRSFEEENSANDTKLTMHIKLPLFIQLCVQASRCTSFCKEPFQELLQRFKDGKIIQKEERKKPYAIMTEKDCYYRLMSYIQKDQNSKDCMVNGKEVYLEDVSFMTEEDKINTENEHQRINARNANRDPNKEYPQGRCFVGCFSGHSQIHEVPLRISLLKDDKEHHEKVVEQFELLLKK